MHGPFSIGAVCLCVFLVTSACGQSRDAASTTRTYRLTDHDALTLRLPGGWNDDIRSLPGEPFPSVFLAPVGDDPGGMVLTVMGRSGPDSGGPTEEQLKQAVEDAAA